LEVNVAPFGSTGIKVFMTHGGDLIVHAGHDEQMENDGHISRRYVTIKDSFHPAHKVFAINSGLALLIAAV
jgi:uncharacterized protein (DUF1330 family)